MRLRIRSPNGVANVTLPDTATVADLKAEISSKTTFPAFTIKSGFPPKDLDLDQFDDQLKVSDTGLKLDGEQLIATERVITAALKHPLTHALSPTNRTSEGPFHRPDEPSVPMKPAERTSQPSASSRSVPPRSQDNIPDLASSDPPEIPLPSVSGTLVLRVMPDDNACLFRAFSSATLGNNIDSMHELRSYVASTIQSQPDIYNAAVLDKQPDAYCRWISREDAWGGAIELGILSQQFDVEVCSINVQDLRIDRFNEGQSRMIVLVYSGIHYDVIALSPSEPPHTHTDLPAEFDVKVFDVGKDEILQGALELCRILQQRHYYTDTSGFEVKCNQCGWTGHGEKEATKHAKATGHMDFGEK